MPTMSDEFPASTPRRKLEITLDDLGEPAPTVPQPPPAGPFPPVGRQPKPPVAQQPPPQHPPAQHPPAQHPPQYPPPQHPPAQYPPSNNPNMAAVALAMNHKSAGVAVLLSLLWTGAGQVYCGRAGRGVAFFCAAVFAWCTLFFVIGFILLPAVWIWAAVDAASLANRQNAMLMASVASQPFR